MKSFFTTLVIFLFYLELHAQPGTLDYSFGDSGKVISTFYEGEIRASALQPSGKIVVGGLAYNKKGALLERYNQDGSLDLSFGNNGKTSYNLGDTTHQKSVTALAVQNVKRIVMAGIDASSAAHIFLMGVNEDGSVDEEFGEKGFTLTKISRDDYPADMTLLPDGRIAVTGQIQDGINDNSRGFLALYTSDGKLDKNFGDTGITIIQLSSPMYITAIAVTKEGKIIVGGNYIFINKTFLLGYNNDGTPDKSFGVNGLAEMSFDKSITSPAIRDIAITPDNTIATAGFASIDSRSYGILVSRFLVTGEPDNTFGTNGYTSTKYEKGDVRINAIAVQTNGKIVAGGYLLQGESSVFTVARYDIDGLIDSAFGVNGIANTSFYAQDQGASLLIQKDGKIVLSGNSYIPFPQDKTPVALARYNGDDSKKQIIVTRIKRWLQHHGISWQTDNNVRYYNVQRSNDGGITYQPVAKIYNNRQPQYNYEEATATNNSLYRIAAVGKDGSRTYSNSVLINNEASVSVFPNPVRNNLQVQGLAADGKTNISITDFSGTMRTSAVASGSTYSINTANLKPGNYLLKVQHDNTITTKTFVKE